MWIKLENRAKMEMPRKTWTEKEKRERERECNFLALTGMESIRAKIIVVILTMQNPFGGSGIQMETMQAWFKREYHTNPDMKNGFRRHC